jgi:uncharacterized membrane protein HdeD (DUF308 family)
MNEMVNEPFGFKVAMTGGATWFASMLQGIDLTQVLGFAALVVGVFIQIVSHIRNKKADERAKQQYALEMKLLTRQLEELEEKDGVKS